MRQINTMNLILEEDIFHAHAFFNFAYTFLFGSNASKYIQTKHFRTGYLVSISNVNGRRPMT